MFLFCVTFLSSVTFSGGRRGGLRGGEYQKLQMSLDRSIIILHFVFLSFKDWLCVLVVAPSVHVCQFSKARAPVVEVVVVLVASAARGIEGTEGAGGGAAALVVEH